MANRLARETSPYLLQHKDNPVDWHPWGDEALARARDEDKPILLSIGYSACHWCHVMAHESFENASIAALMNELFVNIKVDREERPDLDSLYMMAVQMMTGQGGWPMTVFLTPDGQPFYGGTYYPPEDRGPMPGFPRILRAVAAAYRERRAEIDDSAATVTSHLRAHFESIPPGGSLDAKALDEAARSLAGQFDRVNGGFGGAPKFPSPMSIELLLRFHHRAEAERALQMAELTLDKMARGGIYDQVGGGFHRYAVDAIWLVPHFEKMLYDNAQLAHVYTLAWQVTGEPFYEAIARETIDYVLREMTSPNGGFYSTQDADTEGHEGRFYVWTPRELTDALGEQAGAEVAALLGATERGNFEGSNVLSIADVERRMEWRSGRYAALRQRLYEWRSQRAWPGRDEKILTSWNGMMLRAISLAAWAFDDERYAAAAVANAVFVRDHLLVDGMLLRSWKDGEARLNGYLEDYANYIDGLIELYGATFDTQWIELARSLAHTMVDEFHEAGGFYDTGRSHEELVSRPRDAHDNATPSGNSVACHALLRLEHLTGDRELGQIARDTVTSYANHASEHAHGYSRLLCALDVALGPNAEIVIAGERTDERTRLMLGALREEFLPRAFVALAERDSAASSVIPALAGREPADDGAVAYVCVDSVCQLPTRDVDEMLRMARSAQRAPIAAGD